MHKEEVMDIHLDIFPWLSRRLAFSPVVLAT